MDLPRPFEVLEAFGEKSKSEAPRAFKFCAKRVPIEVNNWWKFGVDISNQLWDIPRYKDNFQKLFLYLVGGTLNKKIFKFEILRAG